MKTKEILELSDILNGMSKFSHTEETIKKVDDIYQLMLDQIIKKLE